MTSIDHFDCIAIVLCLIRQKFFLIHIRIYTYDEVGFQEIKKYRMAAVYCSGIDLKQDKYLLFMIKKYLMMAVMWSVCAMRIDKINGGSL